MLSNNEQFQNSSENGEQPDSSLREIISVSQEEAAEIALKQTNESRSDLLSSNLKENEAIVNNELAPSEDIDAVKKITGDTEDELNRLVLERDKQLSELKSTQSSSEVENQHVTVEPLEFFNNNSEAVRDHFRKLEMEYSNVLPVKDSVVRIEQQQKIIDDLEEGVPTVVEAYWRHGKTSMLKSIGREWEEKNDIEPLYMDVSMREHDWKNASAEETRESFGEYNVSRYLRQFPDIEPEEYEAERKDKTPFQALDSLMQKQGKRVLVEMDELLGIAQKGDGSFEAIMQDMKGLKNISVLIAWHPLDTLAKEADVAYAGYERKPIKPLSIEDAKTLIERPLKSVDSKVSFSDDAIKKIYDYAGGRPMDMNLFCAQLTGGSKFDAVQKMRYEADDIETFIKKNNLSNTRIASDAFTATCKNIPDLFNHILMGEHKNAIEKMARENGQVASSELSQDIANELINLGLIVKEEKSDTYRINGQLTLDLLKEQVERA